MYPPVLRGTCRSMKGGKNLWSSSVITAITQLQHEKDPAKGGHQPEAALPSPQMRIYMKVIVAFQFFYFFIFLPESFQEAMLLVFG